MTGPVRPLHLVPDVERHGVTRYACDIATAAGCEVVSQAPLQPGRPLHLHFTDRLWGADPAAAAARVVDLARRHPLTVTLHDLPQASDGAVSQPRRAAAYAQVAEVARAVACNSRWEAQLLSAVAAGSSAVVIPLAVPPLATAAVKVAEAPERPAIGLLGFVYPGKGHAEAIEAAAACTAALGSTVDVIALGAVSRGHHDDAAALGEQARQRGISFTVTGYLSDRELLCRARQVAVPVAAHQHVSASASVGSWLAAGRRPWVLDSPYAREIDALRPGTIRRYAPADLAAAVGRTLADPRSSWLGSGADLRPGPRETAAAYRHWWSETVTW